MPQIRVDQTNKSAKSFLLRSVGLACSLDILREEPQPPLSMSFEAQSLYNQNVENMGGFVQRRCAKLISKQTRVLECNGSLHSYSCRPSLEDRGLHRCRDFRFFQSVDHHAPSPALQFCEAASAKSSGFTHIIIILLCLSRQDISN